MVKSKTEKKKQKRQAKKKQVKSFREKELTREKGWDHMGDARFFYHAGNMNLALKAIQRAAKILPHEEEVLCFMGYIAAKIQDPVLELEAMAGMEKIGKITDEMQVERVYKLSNLKRFPECLQNAEKVLETLPHLKVKNKRGLKKDLQEIKNYCEFILAQKGKKEAPLKNIPDFKSPPQDEEISHQMPPSQPVPEPAVPEVPVPEVPLIYTIAEPPFFKALSNPEPATPERYELALLSHEIRFAESFDSLVCLPSLTRVTSFWYQEETAKKVLKQFRGRAMLSDEVGLGKTIEALIILTEYIKRGMVKTGLILTPTPLVSQWQDEITSKFNLEIPSTDDPGFKSGEKAFWDQPFVIASINQAKSKKNSDFILAREYDMIIVDEAHHLKNRTTQNWKLVNSLKKRFILLLTATPVENNLMELYNLITLLKPGQLETATSFREKFMKRGDPTDPQNRVLLKELLGQVMIRNTRALAGLHIPPRFAQTIRIEPTLTEQAFYERLEALIRSLNEHQQSGTKMVVTNLLAQAGSSPRAVEYTLTRMLEKEDFLQAHEQELRALKNLCHNILDTPKNKALLKVIRAGTEKIIVFVKYKGTIEHLAEFLEWNHISFSLFHGGMNNAQREAAIEAFQNKNQVLVTTEIGGEGRNLQFCSRMVNYDLPWNPMKIEQRIGRIHRIGQEREVHIFNFCAIGSLEDYILDILDRKINMFEMVIGEIDMILGRIRGEKEFSDIIYDIWVNSKTREEREKSFNDLGTALKRAKTGYHKTRELDEKLFGNSYEL